MEGGSCPVRVLAGHNDVHEQHSIPKHRYITSYRTAIAPCNGWTGQTSQTEYWTEAVGHRAQVRLVLFILKGLHSGGGSGGKQESFSLLSYSCFSYCTTPLNWNTNLNTLFSILISIFSFLSLVLSQSVSIFNENINKPVLVIK